jgi:hypothetical protein
MATDEGLDTQSIGRRRWAFADGRIPNGETPSGQLASGKTLLNDLIASCSTQLTSRLG